MLGNPLLLTLSFDSCRTKRFNQIQIIFTTTYVGSSDLVISFIWYYSVRLLKACNHVQTGTRLVSLSVQLVTKQPKSCFVLWILLTEHFWSRDKTLLKESFPLYSQLSDSKLLQIGVLKTPQCFEWAYSEDCFIRNSKGFELHSIYIFYSFEVPSLAFHIVLAMNPIWTNRQQNKYDQNVISLSQSDNIVM